MGDRPDDIGGCFELYADGLTVWTSSRVVLDAAIALIDDELGGLVRLDERRCVPLDADSSAVSRRQRAA